MIKTISNQKYIFFKNMKKAGYIIALLVVLFSLTGCFATESMNGDSGSRELAPLSLGIDATSIESIKQTTPEHIVVSVNGVLEVDASVYIPEIKEVKRLTTSLHQWDAEKATTAFLTEPYSINEYFDTDAGIYYVEAESQSAEENIVITNGDLMTVNMSQYQYYAAATSVVEAHYELNNFYPETELTFLSIAEAKKLLKTEIQKLGLTMLDENMQVSSLTAGKMNEQAKVYLESGPSKTITEEGDVIDLVVTVPEYTVDDEMYVFKCYQGVEGIPLTRFSYIDPQSGKSYLAHEINAYINKEGIIFLHLSTMMDESVAMAEDFESLIPVDQALNLASEKYLDIIGGANIKITEIALEYLQRPCENEEDVQLDLVWSLSNGIDSQYSMQPIFVNAFTGEVY